MKRFLAYAFALAIAIVPFSAQATILFVGGEDSDFVNLNSTAASITAGTFSSGYARASLAVTGSNCGGNSPPSNYFMTPTFTASSTIWIHANYVGAAGTGCGSPSDVLRVYSPDGYARLSVTMLANGPTGQYSIYTRNQAGTNTLLVSMPAPCFSESHVIPLDLYINYATSGEVTLFCNGVQVADYTGNLTTDSATQLNQVQFAGVLAGNVNTYWSEIIVSTTDTHSMRLVTLAPAANGNTDTFDSGGVSNINETTLNQATVNASGTAGQEQEYTVSTGSFPSGTFSVLGVWLNAQAQVDTTGPQHLQGVVRTGGSDFASANLAPPQSAWGFISTSWLTNPNTGTVWSTSDLTNAGFNIGFNSQN